MESKIDFESVDANRDRLAVLLRRLESPRPHCFNCLFIQAIAKVSYELDLSWQSIGADHQRKYDRALYVGTAGLDRIVGIRGVNEFRRRYCAFRSPTLWLCRCFAGLR